jgi:CubicO group peptidase (beta-lactamase class C family)
MNPTIDGPLNFDNLAEPEEVGMNPEGVERIQQVFAGQLRRRLHFGAQLVIARHGRVVVDMAGGMANLAKQSAVTIDTPFLVFSVTKPFTAVCIHRLAEDGRIDLEARVADYWPEFGCKGKEQATIRHVLLHQAGVPLRGTARQVFLWKDWEQVTRQVAGLAAEYPPGARSSYHLANYGFILGEVIRRVSGLQADAYLHENFLEPLGLWNSRLRLPAHELGQAAGVYSGHPQQALAAYLSGRPEIRTALMPAAGLHSTARDVAIFFQMLVNQGTYAGQSCLKPETVAHMTALHFQGRDQALQRNMRYGLGVMLGGLRTNPHQPGPIMGEASTARTFGHPGQSSSIAWADPDAELVLAFTCNRLLRVEDAMQRWKELADAAWGAILR